jgi:hypothetical protein
VCSELPGLESNDVGRYSSVVALEQGGLAVSGYDGKYGDLVVLEFGLDGVRAATTYVDGVPTLPAKFGPTGPRGGVVEPGQDVGRYTDIARAADGRLMVSYYDATNGDLKLATRGTNGSWTTHRVDGAQSNSGLFTSLAIDADGRPGVSYFQLGAESAADLGACPVALPTKTDSRYVTALKFARASTPSPTSDADWVIKTIACLSRPPPPCDGCLDVCVSTSDGGVQCAKPATTCSACDAKTETCVARGSTSACAKTFTPPNLVEIPSGVGLYTSLAFRDRQAFIAFMKRSPPSATAKSADGDLLAVTVSADNVAAQPVVLDSSGDTGYFPDLKIDPSTNEVVIAYHDFTAKSLKFLRTAQLKVGLSPQVIDRGVSSAAPGLQAYAGTDASLVFAPEGAQLWVVYQDATRSDLKIARVGATGWEVLPPLVSDGAVGFYADAVFAGGKVYVSHVRIKAVNVADSPTLENELRIEQVADR